MWPLPDLKNEYIALNIQPNAIACGWIDTTKKHPAVLHAYSKIPLEQFSSITLMHALKQFVDTHNLTHSFLDIALATPIIHEELIRAPHASPTNEQIIPSTLKKMMCDYRYLHALDDGQHLFYLSAIDHSILFACQLLATKNNLYARTISSSYMVLLQVYKVLCAQAFRQSQLALVLTKHEYNIEHSISVDSLSRLLYIPSTISLDIGQEKLSLLTMLGLYYQERG